MQGEDGRVYYTINQHECDRITIVITNNYLGDLSTETHTLKLDGKEQKDSPWYGGPEQYRTSAKFINSKLQIKARIINGPTSTTTYSLTKARNLSIDSRTGSPDAPSIAKRQK